MNKALAVFPVAHGASRLETMVRITRGDESLIQDDRGLVEPGLDIAIRPVDHCGSGRRHAPVFRHEIFIRPFVSLERDAAIGCVAAFASVGSFRTQAVERIHNERQRFNFDL